MALRIVLVDDHYVVRAGFRSIIEQQASMQIVGEASNCDEAIALIGETKPDILITDISMGTEKNGLLLTELVKDSFPQVRVVILSMHEEQEYLRQALSKGALGYVLKSASDDELIKAIQFAAEDKVYISEDLMDGFVRDTLSGEDPAAKALSPREAELVSLAVKGYSNKEIADALGISVKTVESFKTKIMTKLGLSSKRELFDYAVAHNLVKLS